MHRLNRYEEAIESYTHTLEINPNDWNALYWYSILLFYAARYEEAIDRLNQMLELRPDDADTRYNKACCHARIEQCDTALDSLQQAIELKPEYREVAKNDEDFQSLRGNARFKQLIDESD